ncbi:MAG: ABC transporter permease subunit [Kofleriaceae bacterium]|nr:ABC transporter permease subunit [Kofleriaceae bacterium]
MSTKDDPKGEKAAGATAEPAASAAPKPPPRDLAAEAAALANLEAGFEAEQAAVATSDGGAEQAAIHASTVAKAVVAEDARKAAGVAKPAATSAASDAAKPAGEAVKAAKPSEPPPAKEKTEPADDPNRLPEPPPWWKTLRADPPAYTRTLLGVGLIFLLLLVWWFVTRGAVTDRIISPSKLPSPGEVFGSMSQLLKRSLDESTFATLERVFKGLALAAIVGIGIGVLAASNRGVGSALAPLVIFLRSVPMGALIPLTLLLFGDGEKQKWMFIFLAIVPFVFSDTVKAISIVPERYVETAQTLGASRFQIVRKVLVPLALPDIITSLRFQLGLALGYIMLVEEINTEHGLGTLIIGGQKRGLTEQTFLLLFVIALIAFTLDLALRTIQRGVFAWRKDL